MTTQRKPDYIAYAVNGEAEQAFWNRIGAVWQHKNGGGLSIELSALPVNRRTVLLRPKQESAPAAETSSRTARRSK